MEKQDMRRMMRLALYVYAPIALLFVAIFLIVESQLSSVDHAQKNSIGADAGQPSLVIKPAVSPQ